MNPDPRLLKSDPERWERSWQAMLDVCFSPSRAKITGLEAIDKWMSPSAVQNISDWHRQLCTLQSDLAKHASAKCASDSFEEEWRRCGAEGRREHYFEGMRRMQKYPGVEELRVFAPEMTLRNVEVDNGEGYLKLLRLLMPETLLDQDRLDRFAMIPHPLIDDYLKLKQPFDTSSDIPKDATVYAQKTFVVVRTFLITLVVWNIFLSFYGLSEDVIPTKTKRGKTQEIPRPSTLSQEKLLALEKETRRDMKLGQRNCHNCEKTEAQIDGVLKVCKKCSVVFYCSRECQVNDWKYGTPPHKSICGKSLDELLTMAAETTEVPHTPSSPSASTTTNVIGPPAPGYRRSPALVHHIAMLEKEASRPDYFFMLPSPYPDYGMQCPDALMSRKLCLLREQAFSTGDEICVRAMYKWLSHPAGRIPHYGLKGLQRQMMAEFGIDVTREGSG